MLQVGPILEGPVNCRRNNNRDWEEIAFGGLELPSWPPSHPDWRLKAPGPVNLKDIRANGKGPWGPELLENRLFTSFAAGGRGGWGGLVGMGLVRARQGRIPGTRFGSKLVARSRIKHRKLACPA